MRRALPYLLFLTFVALGAVALLQAREADADEPAVASGPPAATVTPVLSARRAPELLAGPVADNRLRRAVEPFLEATPGSECLVVSVGGRRIVEADAAAPLVPASNQKLLVSAAALHELGADSRLTTTVAAAAAPNGGVVEGDLWFVGGGDPLLATDSYVAVDDPPRPNTDLEALADDVVAAGVTEVRGDVVGDESRYDDTYDVPAWPNRTLNRSKPGALSALAVNKGFETWPEGPDDPTGPEVAADPARNSAELLKLLLVERGVTVTGGSRSGPAPDGLATIATIDSLTVAELVDEMNTYSDNTTAEMLVKEIGFRRSGEGSTTAGAAAVSTILGELGLPTGGVEVLDGSGLANDKVTCDLLAAILEQAGRESGLAEGLPVAGKTGTLRARFLQTEAVGRLRAKSGFLNQSTALSGFVDTVPGAVVTFAYVGNDDFVTQQEVNLQEQLAEVLVQYPQGVDLAQLEPRPVP